MWNAGPYGGYPPAGGYRPQMSGMGMAPPGSGYYPRPPPPQQLPQWHAQYYNQLSPAEIAELQSWFQTVDRDGSGSITADELQGLAFGGQPLGYSSALKLLKVFDTDYSNSIDFYEYASLHKFISTLQNSFLRADGDHNGVLDQREIAYALHCAGYQLSAHAVDALYRKHDLNTNKGVSFSMFLALAADVALLRRQFTRFDVTKSGYITVTFDQLIQMVGDI